MNKDILEGKWNEYKGKVKEKWGKLTDDELTEIKGKKDQLLGKLQAKYGWSKDLAEKEFEQFEKSLSHMDKVISDASKRETLHKPKDTSIDHDEHHQKRKAQ